MMKQVTIFYLEGCPYCAAARRSLDRLRSERPELLEAEIRWIEERRQPEVAERYDYYYVPAVFSGDRKLWEARPGESEEEIFAHLADALERA